MSNTPEQRLGEVFAVTITTEGVEGSLAFYQKLGFKELYRSNTPFPWIQISDGALLIMLREDSAPFISLTYYVKDIEQKAATLEAEGIVFAIKPGPSDMIKRYLIKSPDGMNIALVSLVDVFKQPIGKNLLTISPEDLYNPEKYENKVCGLFGEFAHPVSNIDLSLDFWNKLGFKTISRVQSPYNWAIISDGLSIVGLHETTSFSSPAITFFASDMTDKITNLIREGLIRNADGKSNIILDTPEKQKINLFKLGM